MEKIHRRLLNYLPLLGYAVWAIMTGFDNELFPPVLLSGWIVMVVYQTILSAIYSPPRYILLSIASLLITPLLLFVNAYLKEIDYSVIFIEVSAVGLISIIIALIAAFIIKAVKEGMPPEVRFAVIFTIGLFGTAGYFMGKLLYRFFESQQFDWVNILVVAAGISSTSFYFIHRMHALTNRFSGQMDTAKKNEFPVSGVLITLFTWIALVPLAMWVKMLMADQ